MLRTIEETSSVPTCHSDRTTTHSSSSGERHQRSMDPRISRALSFIESSPTHLISIEITAASVSLSSSRLRHLFKDHMGISFHQHLMRVRLSRAKTLLHSTDHPVARIWQLVGDRDISHFTRDYKRVYGVTPGADRRRGAAHGSTTHSQECSSNPAISAPVPHSAIGRASKAAVRVQDQQGSRVHSHRPPSEKVSLRQNFWC